MGLRISEPGRLWDVDTPEDYRRALACGLVNRN
jgi:CTP:molybdopterin cytidylyltransferase MocA